ncbi:hypothetical protein [Clostridium botulinum]|uniref:hypothetical protein n=1 Tax=Clostridium botulinum TaxID=1491 RepID=UPI0004D61CB1|nr:hypothetical protein [Clostridium botulinum]KEH99827.1 hypothetical protein Z952_p0156 [Clostridium botulinum C/D str. BKT75002]KEI05305.1 hypothetical protein Z954_0157 [Clostridium botulinum C/D str. BKT2873]QPW61995.1 hypothetical protein IG390_14160 [Clostridium botulinum]
MPYFADMSQLEKEIKKQSIKALKDDVSRIIKDELKNQVLDKVYSHPSSDSYQRTYELLKSIEIGDVKEENGMYIAQVYFNPEYTHESWWGSSKLGIQKGEQVGMNYIAQWLNEDKNIFAPYTKDFIENTEIELRNTKSAINAFIGYMQSRGIKII